jgi:hypothetical protein
VRGRLQARTVQQRGHLDDELGAGGEAPDFAERALIAALVRYMLTPSQLTRAGLARSKPEPASCSMSESASKLTGTKVTAVGVGMQAADRSRCFHPCMAG